LRGEKMRIVDDAKRKIEEMLEEKKNRVETKRTVSEGEEREVKTYKVVINGTEIEVPEGFEVVVRDGEYVLRKGSSDDVKAIRKILEDGVVITV